MTKTFVDTSFSIALASDRDFDHAKAVELAGLYDGSDLLITDCVRLEIGNSLARKFRQQAVETIANFLVSLEVEVVPLTPELFLRAFDIYQTHSDKTWGLVDCVSFVVMKDRGIRDALTNDHHFIQAGFNALMIN